MELVKEIATIIQQNGGTCYYVGGFVRDSILKRENTDIDVEVFGISGDLLASILSKFGEVDYVGKSYGTYKLHSTDIEFSIPRTEFIGKISGNEVLLPKETDLSVVEKIQTAFPDKRIVLTSTEQFGHKDFLVIPLKEDDVKTAAVRRDISINAIYMDVFTGEYVDFFGGMDDIKNKIIRCVDEHTFPDDPLRVLRVCRFAATLGFRVDQKTIDLCKSISVKTLPKERIFNELTKILLKSAKPSIGLEYLLETTVIHQLFPELECLPFCLQRRKTHPEGNVWIHTMMVTDAAADFRDFSSDALSFMYGALCHDIGKPISTTVVGDDVTVKNHEENGAIVSVNFMKRLTNEKNLIKNVKSLVSHHMRPYVIFAKEPVQDAQKSIKRLIVSTQINDVILLSLCDCIGRGASDRFCCASKMCDWLANQIKMIEPNCLTPYVTGDDLIGHGLKPGPEFKEILNHAFDMQLSGYSKEEILSTIF